MEKHSHIFHLAVPCKDLEETVQFYEQGLGCRVARRYADRATLDFFGDQVVLHLSPDKIDQVPKMYPRHFGVTFRDRAQFDAFLERARNANLEFFNEPFVRFAGKPEEHHTFFLKDPSNNLIEVKYYLDASFVY
ncbi:MAG: VOC family protein [Bdellovibrionales bacterium]|nr:VOC family protein [Bdellovibrionales bacterium]